LSPVFSTFSNSPVAVKSCRSLSFSSRRPPFSRNSTTIAIVTNRCFNTFHRCAVTKTNNRCSLLCPNARGRANGVGIWGRCSCAPDARLAAVSDSEGAEGRFLVCRQREQAIPQPKQDCARETTFPPVNDTDSPETFRSTIWKMAICQSRSPERRCSYRPAELSIDAGLTLNYPRRVSFKL